MIVKLKFLLHRYFSLMANCSLIKFIIIQFPIIILFSFFIKTIFFLLSVDQGINTSAGHFNDKPPLLKFFILVLLAPLFETFVFQTLPYLILNKIPLIKNKTYFILFFSSLLFALSHTYAISYVVYAFFMGILLMGSYLIRLKKGDSFQAVFTLHMLANCLVFFGEFFQS